VEGSVYWVGLWVWAWHHVAGTPAPKLACDRDEHTTIQQPFPDFSLPVFDQRAYQPGSNVHDVVKPEIP